ncbi:hypothetical protein AWN76_012825 [Rhodothermaceae bacterium RA]|nr:hypothetical protein AWN76_012825 [Rhodothermaceae bacterium RA]
MPYPAVISAVPIPITIPPRAMPACLVRRLSLPLVLAAGLLLAGCAAEPEGPSDAASAGIVPATRADSIALKVYEAHGGPEAWASVPYLRFDFAVGQGGQRQRIASHLWDRHSGAYRVEWTRGADSTYVALFNVNHHRDGQVYLNGEPVPATQNAELLEQAYRRYINDTYWMLMPVKLFDPGVQRTYVPDSSDADTDVIRLSFEQVGLTPGDQYWVYVDRATGRVKEWAFVLQSGNRGRFAWTAYEEFDAPAGTIATAKPAIGADRTLYTDRVEVLTEVPADLFTDPRPRLVAE